MKNLFYFFLMIFGASCTELHNLVNQPLSYRNKYLNELHAKVGGSENAGILWDSIGKKSLYDSLFILLPHAEQIYASGDSAESFSWSFTVQAGRILNIEIKGLDSTRLFSDLFVAGNMNDPLNSIMSKGQGLISFESQSETALILRVQPEVGIETRFEIRMKSEPVLCFPVAGKTVKDVRSFWGDPRDGGSRSHEGVDVFAKRGTPLIAVSDGYITNTSLTKRGGKVIWIWDRKSNQRYYYAHLDSQYVSSGDYVYKGDTIGAVGNTGNAKSTPPHLHFGIYKNYDGAIDPYGYIDNSIPGFPLTSDTESMMGNTVRVKRLKTSIGILNQCGKNGTLLCKLDNMDEIKISGIAGDYLRVLNSQGIKGYLPKASVKKI